MITNYLRNKILDHVLRNTAYTPASTVYVALYTVAPDVNGAGGTEVTGGSYARQSMSFVAASAGSTSNNATVIFPSLPACTIVAVGLVDASTGGNILDVATLASSVTVAAAESYTFNAGTYPIGLT